MPVEPAYAVTDINVGVAVSSDVIAYAVTDINVIPPADLDPTPGDTDTDFNISSLPCSGPDAEGITRLWPKEEDVTIVVPVVAGELSESAVLLSDGRVLYVFVDPGPSSFGVPVSPGGSVKQGYAPDLGTFLSMDGSVTGITTIFDNMYGPNACVFHDPAGQLFLVTTAVDGGPEITKGTKVWRSPSGLGGDWVPRGSVQSLSSTRVPWDHLQTEDKSIGQPFFVGARWLLSAPAYTVGSDGVRIKWQGIWSTEDEGFSWTLRHSHGYHIIGGPYGRGQSRNFGSFGGALYWAGSSEIGTVNDVTASSVDGGLSWTTASMGSAARYLTYPLHDDAYIYRLDGGNGVASRSSAPGSGDTGFAAIRDYPMSLRNGAIIQKLGDAFAYMHDGKLLALKCPPGGWRISVVE